MVARVLIVEDDSTVSSVLCAYLRKSGYVRRLREKIERDPADPRLVLTVRGFGYRFDGEAIT